MISYGFTHARVKADEGRARNRAVLSRLGCSGIYNPIWAFKAMAICHTTLLVVCSGLEPYCSPLVHLRVFLSLHRSLSYAFGTFPRYQQVVGVPSERIIFSTPCCLTRTTLVKSWWLTALRLVGRRRQPFLSTYSSVGRGGKVDKIEARHFLSGRA